MNKEYTRRGFFQACEAFILSVAVNGRAQDSSVDATSIREPLYQYICPIFSESSGYYFHVGTATPDGRILTSSNIVDDPHDSYRVILPSGQETKIKQFDVDKRNGTLWGIGREYSFPHARYAIGATRPLEEGDAVYTFCREGGRMNRHTLHIIHPEIPMGANPYAFFTTPDPSMPIGSPLFKGEDDNARLVGVAAGDFTLITPGKNHITASYAHRLDALDYGRWI